MQQLRSLTGAKSLIKSKLFHPLLPSQRERVRLRRAQSTIICLHGFWCDSTANKELATHFEQSGYKTVNWKYSTQHSIEELAENLLREVRGHLDQSEGDIHFCAHSLGGLVLRCLLNHPLCPKSLKKSKAVLIAPPWNGTKWGRMLNRIIPGASFLAGKAGSQLLQTQDKGFDTFGHFPDEMEVLVILGKAKYTNPLLGEPNDGKVMHSESKLATPHHTHIIPEASHGDLQENPVTRHMALNFFDGVWEGNLISQDPMNNVYL